MGSHAPLQLPVMFAQLALSFLLVASHPTVDPADFGPWAGLIECESGGNVTIENPHSTASGLFQFLDTTWRMTATHAGRFDLVTMRAKDATVADQFAMAVHLRDMPGGGISHWVCGYRYADTGGAVLFTAEELEPVFQVLVVPQRLRQSFAINVR